MHSDYDPRAIEVEAQAFWEDRQSFRAIEDPAREKFYCLSMFPYPSGRLHMGHVRNYTIGDVISRYQRMLGKNVLQPMGWDAFGLPAENAAIKHGIPPSQWTRSNVEYMKAQLKQLGFGYDWARELATCDPDYYRWEQWLFGRLVDKGLAYRATAMVNWDPVDQTVLANEQVIDGRGWRSGAPVEKREIEQWSVRITDYAQELLDALDTLDGWPEQVRTMQRNWIGRSEGVAMTFGIEGSDATPAETLGIYTTRADTLMGVTYVAVAAEHPLARRMAEQDAGLTAFIEDCRQGGISEAEIETMEKKGHPLGLNALHPVTGEPVPIYAANFVLMGYGTGAVMAVPGHDQRDWEFAERYGIPKKQVIIPVDGAPCGIDKAAFVEKGILTDSGPFDGLASDDAIEAIADWLAEHGRGEKRVNYRVRDWGVSRQRYWGCPLPIVRGADGGVRVETELPVRLPEDVVVDGSGSPLKKMPAFYELPNGETRETDTFDTFVESSWYYARYCSADCDSAMLDERANYWLPVDQYVGGIEHAVLHLLYARFFHKLMRDEGLVDCDEPFARLLTQGMVVAETWYREGADGRKHWFNPAEIKVTRDDKGQVVGAVLEADGEPVFFGGIEKMSKSKNNGVDPEQLIDRYGADTVRLYTMFTAPPDQSLEWNDEGVEGAARFLKRLWHLAATQAKTAQVAAPDPSAAPSADQPPLADLPEPLATARRELHLALKKALFDYERQQFNTVVSGCMTMVNVLHKLPAEAPPSPPKGAQAVFREGLTLVLQLLAPIAPHVSHYLWRELGFGEDILQAGWPAVDEAALEQDSIEYVVQVNGKVRGKIQVPATAERAEIEAAALGNENVARHLEDKRLRKVILVPAKLVNLVVA
ncbi:MULTISPECIES: leucine--tRNA ligase [Thiorhodovibrio]|uniref:leucine--tRNA ligase n=1 Tax=Thiorhodovibrio TaxID=61593 RepID=UPI0019130B9F|nr:MULTISPECIES: leucine--tRNA ligase [Thiorhodovibrio]MBK5968381.1 leucine--tRNA ligase [Thiorhodovibrio winogradskyi]WPL13166.1 Leucine--tRNA ligase [Thiorhodovibrio litoralis]